MLRGSRLVGRGRGGCKCSPCDFFPSLLISAMGPVKRILSLDIIGCSLTLVFRGLVTKDDI